MSPLTTELSLLCAQVTENIIRRSAMKGESLLGCSHS